MLGLWVLVLVFLTPTRASEPRVVSYKTYHSTSGQYALEVDPTDIYGRGAGNYRFLKDGQEAWSKSLPFTFFDAVIANDGTCIGYAYEHGWTGFARRDGASSSGPGVVRFVALDAGGALRLDQSLARAPSLAVDFPPEPTVDGILLHEAGDRFIIRTSGEKGDAWWIYQLSTGRRMARLNPQKAFGPANKRSHVETAVAIPETPLILLQWTSLDTGDYRAQFMAVNLEGKPVWTLVDPTVTDAPQNRILDAAPSGRFDLWFPHQQQRATFQITGSPQGKTGWQVQEVSRDSYQPPTPPGLVSAPVPPRPLALLGSFRLEPAPPPSAIQGIRAFAFDAQGRVGILHTLAGRETFTLYDQTAGIVAQSALPTAAPDSVLEKFHAVPIGIDRWLLIAGGKGQKRVWAWWFDVQEKRLSEAPFLLDSPGAMAVVADGQDGFAILSARDSSELRGFDRAGTLRWKIAGHTSKPGGFYQPQDLAWTCTGDLAVLEDSGAIHLYSTKGRYLRSIDLSARWKRGFLYVTGFAADSAGGFFVRPGGGDQSFIRTAADGKIRPPLRPRHRDGRLIDPIGGVLAAPDGRLWACDRQALLRLDEEGVADQSIGRDWQPEVLADITAAAADRQGHLYVVDRRTGAVHVYDSTGRKLRICQPGPDDFRESLNSPHIAVADDGSVYLQDSVSAPQRGSLRFDPTGRRMGVKALALDSQQDWYPQPGTDNFVVTTYQSAALLGPEDKVIRSVDRLADRRWMESIAHVAFAGDGTFAIQSWNRNSAPVTTLFARDGTVLRTLSTGSTWSSLIGYNGTHFVVRRENMVEIFDVHGTPGQSFQVPVGKPWEAVLTQEGRELWFLDFTSREVQRYQMP